MSMKTWVRVGKTLEYGLYIAMGLAVVKIVSSLVFGIHMHKASNAGPEVFYWRVEFPDKDLAKTTYSPIAKNAERKSDLFEAYINNVQPQSLNKAEKMLAEKEKTNKDSLTNDELEQLKSIKIKQNTNNLGATPLYLKKDFPDSFILNPKKTFKIFTEMNYLNAELDFLTFRMFYIEYLNDNLPKKPENFTFMDRDKLSNFFKTSTNPTKTDKNILTFKLGQKDILVNEKNRNALKKYFDIYEPFKKIIKQMVNNLDQNKGIFSIGKTNYDVIVSDTAAMNEMVKIFKILEFNTLLGNSNMTDEEVKTAINGFFTEVALIKPRILTAHILNRIYSYFLITHPFLCSEDYLQTYGGESADYNNYITGLEEIEKELAKDVTNEVKKELKAKKVIYSKKINNIRIRKIYNYFSYLLAMNLPGYDIKLSSEENSRIFPFKYFAYPAVYTQDSKDKPLFDKLNEVMSDDQ